VHEADDTLRDSGCTIPSLVCVEELRSATRVGEARRRRRIEYRCRKKLIQTETQRFTF